MKKITLRNDFHNTEAKVWIPEAITSTKEAYDWMYHEAEEEKRKTGVYRNRRKQYLEASRKLCGMKDCSCNPVKDEEC